MAQSLAIPRVIPNDWKRLDLIVNKIKMRLGSASSPTFTGITLSNTGLHLLDTDASHDLIIAPGSNLTVDRTLTLTTGDSDRTITLSGNPTLDDWFDQSVKIAASPQFTGLTLSGLTQGSVMFAGASGVISQDNSNLFWDDTNNRLGIGTASPDDELTVKGDGARINISSADFENIVMGNRGAAALDTAYAMFKVGGVNTIVLDTAGNSYFNGGYVGIGTTASNAPLEVKGAKPGVVGDHQSGQLQVTGTGGEFYCAVITGHNSYNSGSGPNTQLWYLGSTSSATHDEIAFINRQNAAMHFYTNNTSRMTIDAAGNVTLATIAAEDTDVDKFLVSSSGVVKYRTGTQVLSDIGGQPVHANLTSLATLTYAAAAFVKMTGANTFVLRTIGETADDLQGTIDHDLTANYVADKHVAHAGVSITAGKGLSGGGTIAATRDLALDLTEMTGNVVWNDSTTDASMTWTYALSGANDPVWTIGANSMDLTTGVLKVGGTTVMLVGGAPSAHTIVSHSDTTGTGAELNTLTGGGDVGALHTHAAAYQPLDAVLTDLAALTAVADNEFIVGTGAGTYAHENAATARTSLGLGVTQGPQFSSLLLGADGSTQGHFTLYSTVAGNTLTLRMYDVYSLISTNLTGATAFVFRTGDGGGIAFDIGGSLILRDRDAAYVTRVTIYSSSGNINTVGTYSIDGTQVVSNQGAAVANATDATTTMARLNDLLARCRAHGLIAT